MKCPNCGIELEEVFRNQIEIVEYTYTLDDNGELNIEHEFDVQDEGKYVCGHCKEPLSCNSDEDLKIWFMGEGEFRGIIRAGTKGEPVFEEDEDIYREDPHDW